MRYTTAMTRVLSLILAVTFMLTAFPSSAFAAIDEPLNGVTGNGWNDFGGNITSDSYDFSDDSVEYEWPDIVDAGHFPVADDSTPTDVSLGSSGENTTETQEDIEAATPGTTSGESGDGVLAEWFETYRQWAMSLAIQMFSSIGDKGSPSTTPLTWGSGTESDRVWFGGVGGNNRYINSPVPKISMKGEIAFCYEWNGSTPGGNYTASSVGDDPVIKQILANFNVSNTSSSANYLAAQILIWSRLLGSNVASWGTCPGASAANSMLNGSADASNIEYLIWGGGSQTIITYTNTISDYELRIIKKNEDGSKLVSNATFEVTGPSGFNYTGKTNSQGIINVPNLKDPGTYTVTETEPPAGYDPADPASQTVTLSDANRTATVEFRNKWNVPDTDEPDGEGGNYHIEVETFSTTETEVYNQKSYSYSDAIGQITIRKHDQDGKSLDGALFNIDVAFTDGSHTTMNNWEVDNGARLFTWTHPRDNHDPATVTVTEVQPPRYYTGDPTPKTAVVHPTYTRVTHVETWTVTITTENTSCTVIYIDSGDVVATSNSSSSASDTSNQQVEEFTDFVEGDREITVTFVNQRITGDIIVTKKDANTGQPLAGASVHLWGTDLGEPSTIDRTLVTGADGTAVFDNLPPGTYVFQETQPPYGYNVNSELKTAVLQSGQVLHKEIRNYRKDGLIIKKTDQNGVPLPGAVFELRRGNGEVLLSDVTNQNGIIFRDYLNEGLYVIEEIQAPDGYLIDENPIKELYIYESDDNKQYTVVFVNKKRPSIEITKVDGDTPTVKLKGAVFRITDTRTNQYWDIQTDADGTALLENLDLNTTYVVEELEAPQGYVNSGYRQEIVLKECRKHTITVANRHMPKITIIKKDASSGALLSGATFRISWNSGADYRDITTDDKGEAVIVDLTPGWYTLTETKAPMGYLLDSTPQQILIVDGQDKVIELFNEAKPGLQLKKLDKLTNMPIANAVFSIVRLDNGAKCDLGTFTTGGNGLFYVPDLAPGNYVITEITAPSGYILDSTPNNIYIEGGKLNTVEIFNMPYSALRIFKISAGDERKPLQGAIFKLFDEKRLEIGTYETSVLGEIMIPQLPEGIYYLQETRAPAGYVLDSTVSKIELIGGKTTTVEVKNNELGSLRILKRSKEDGKPLYGATFLLYDSKKNLLGEFTTNQDGLIVFGKNISAGTYKITEIKAPAGFVLDETVRTITVKEGETTEIVLENEPIRGRIQIVKKASEDSSITKRKKGALLEGAVFEIYDSKLKVVDRIISDKRGIAFSNELPVGVYGIKEISAPDYYYTDGEMFYAEIKLHGDLIRFEVLNKPQDISVSVEKRGNVEAMPGDVIRYDFSNIANTSNVPLAEFYWHDLLPTDAVRLNQIHTGTWSERLTYKVTYRTNLKSVYRTLEDKLSTKVDNVIECSREALKLAVNEYITDIRFEFNEVEAGFTCVDNPYMYVTVLGNLPDGYQFINRTTVGGRTGNEWIYQKDAWSTCVFAPPRGKLPRTGY